MASDRGKWAPTIRSSRPIDYEPLIIAYRNGAAVRVADIGKAVDSVEDLRNAGYANGKPSGAGDHLPPARRQHHRNRRSHHAPCCRN